VPEAEFRSRREDRRASTAPDERPPRQHNRPSASAIKSVRDVTCTCARDEVLGLLGDKRPPGKKGQVDARQDILRLPERKPGRCGLKGRAVRPDPKSVIDAAPRDRPVYQDLGAAVDQRRVLPQGSGGARTCSGRSRNEQRPGCAASSPRGSTSIEDPHPRNPRGRQRALRGASARSEAVSSRDVR